MASEANRPVAVSATNKIPEMIREFQSSKAAGRMTYFAGKYVFILFDHI